MDKELLKKKLHEQIDALDDELALEMLHEAVIEYSKAEDTRDDLTPEQLERLKKSLEQAEKGNTVSHEEAKKRIKEWLTR
jgi:predicted transcriptional regulator